MIQTLRISFIALVLVTLSACGGGGGGGTPTAKTTPTPITVIDGYIQGAIVCVDKNKNGSCDTGETQGKTGADGKVVLDIPLDDVGKYPIVAYIPADAIDSDNPSAPVGKAYTMSAPADQSAIVSPLSTLVQRLIDKDSKTTVDATAQIKRTVGDATINYLESADAKSTRLAAKMLAKLLQDPSGLAIASNLSEAEKQAAIKDALLAKLADIQAKAQALVAPGAACAPDIAAQSCQSTIASAIDSVLTTSNSGQPNPPASQTVSQTASITGASSSSTPVINSGDRTDSLRPTLRGSYSAALGTDYSVRVLDGNTDLGAATVTESSKTWTFTPTADLSLGSHSFTALVVRNSDSAKGTASGAFTIKIGNSVGATSGSNVLDTITLALSNIWNSVKSVVFTFSGDSGAVLDGQTSKTVNAPDAGAWSIVTTAFKTAGQKIINLVFKDQAGGTLDSTSITVGVTTGTVSQTASIISVKDDSTSPAVTVDDGKATKDTTPVISGSIDTQLSTDTSPFYDVVVYDNGTALTGTLTYTDSSNKKYWSFTPSSALSQGAHAFTAKVVRFDGQPGDPSPARNAIVLTSSPSFSPSSPNVLDTVTFSVNNLYSGITSVVWDLGDGSAVQSSTVSNGASSITKSYGSQGTRNVTVSYKNSQSIVLATDTLSVAVGAGSVSQTASITGVSDGSAPINSGDRANALTLTLKGTYSGNALGSDYSIRVTDGGTTLGTATLAADTNSKTWSFTTTTLASGSHDFKAVVERVSDGVVGTSSSPYTVKIGNSVSASSGANVLDTITLTLSNLWSNVKSVVFGIPDSPSSNIGQSDLIDGQTSKIVNAPVTGLWSSITTAFKTTGNKIITLVFKDQADQEVDRSSINVNIVTGTVSQKASILSIKDHATPAANEIVAGQVTKYTKPVISGTVDVSLSQFYDVAVFDNGTKLAGQLVYTNNRKDWSFTPANALSQGEHTITAGVVRIDGVEGPKDSERKFVLLLSNIGFSPVNPQLGLPVSFSASNVWSNITTVLWNFGDGVTFRDFTYEGRSNVQHTFAESSGVGNKTVTVSYVDTTGKTVGTEQLVLNLGPPPVVTQLATITTIKDGNNILQSGDWASSNLLSLQGTYQGELGSGFTVEIIVDGTDWDTASIDPATHTWTSTMQMPWYGLLNIQVVVKQHIQTGPFAYVYKEYFGIYSEPFKVKIGNKLTPSSTQLSTWDEWVLTLRNVWHNVRTVVITFVADASDMVDGLVTRTLSGFDPMYMQPRGQSLSISAGFKTTGDKAVNIAYLDGNGQTVSTDSVRLTVNAADAVTQIPTVDAITNIVNQSIVKNGSTSETVSSVDGSLSAAIGKFYYVEVYDNGSNTAIPGTMSYNANRTKWTFTPSAPLAIGSHALTAAVVRGDGVTGARTSSAWNFTLTPPRLIKIGANGTALANQNAKWSDTGNEADGTRWDCIQESDTGRMWEVKPKTPNQLRNSDSTFTYYIPNPRVAGSWVGSETSNGSCNSLPSGKNCNTQNYVDAVNSVGLCGKKDWRLPTDADVAQQVKGFPKLYFPNLSWFWVESEFPTEEWYVEAYSTVFAEVGPVTYVTDGASDAVPVILVRNSR